MSKESCKIISCHCEHKSQDEMYGKGKRVHNPGKKYNVVGAYYKCTVCGNKKER